MASLALVAALTYILFHLVPVNSATVALVFVLAILGIAAKWGLVEAIAASLAAVLCFNFYFLPPVGTFTIADPQNWVALLTFLITSIVASQLSASVRRREREATARRNEVEKLYELSRAMMLAGGPKLAAEVPAQIVRAFNAEAVVFYDCETRELYRAGPGDLPVSAARLKDLALQGTVFQDPSAAVITVPVALGGRNIGSLSVMGAGISEAAAHAFANLMAIALERERDRESAALAAAARQSENLKSALLDAVAHEFKTPLTSIKAAATALLAQDSRDPDSRSTGERELLTVIDEESDRLTQLVDEAIQTARIEAGQARVDARPISLSNLAMPVLREIEALHRERSFDSEIPSTLAVNADSGQVRLVLRQILRNAIKYSPPGSRIALSVHAADGEAVVGVRDQGPGIPAPDLERIFERFYRGPSVRDSIPGAGMGLAIAREIVRAHGGRIWATNLPGQGAEISFTLPLA